MAATTIGGKDEIRQQDSGFRATMSNCIRVVCSSSKSIDYSPCCMATVFGLMAALTLSISLTMFIIQDYAEVSSSKSADDIALIEYKNTYSLTLELDALGDKKFETLIILYGFEDLQQVKFFRYLNYTALAEIENDDQIPNAQNYAINTTFNDIVTKCEYLNSDDIAVGECKCDPDSIVFPFADDLNSNNYSKGTFELKYRLIDWVQIYPFRVLLKHLCAVPAPESNAIDFKKMKITLEKNWNGWKREAATQNVKKFFLKAVYPSKFGGDTTFLQNLGFSLSGVCAVIGFVILIFHHCCKRTGK